MCGNIIAAYGVMGVAVNLIVAPVLHHMCAVTVVQVNAGLAAYPRHVKSLDATADHKQMDAEASSNVVHV